MNEVKAAMKNKDSCTSTTLHSVLSEIYAADKLSNEKVTPSTVISILRKAALRRNDAAAQFTKASRPELADKERREADVLTSFLPPLLSEAEIDLTLREVIDALPMETNALKLQGKMLKAFYSKVEKSLVDPNVVKKRAEAMLSNSGS